jgi:nitrate/nitrite-specific signal transduction histidine kinase
MNEFEPKVNNVSLFREIAKNIVNPLEVLREAISNSHDAESKEISITVSRNTLNDLVLEIADDGMEWILMD